MRGQKVSLRTSVSEAIHAAGRRFQDEEEEQEEEMNALLEEKNKRQSYNESKERFRKEREQGRVSLKGKKKNKKDHRDENGLGIPIGEYLVFGPPFGKPLGLPSIFNRPAFKEEKKEAYKVVRNQGKSYRSEKTLCAQIFKILFRSPAPLHVNEIIRALQRIGILKNETHHVYSIVYRTLTRNCSIFKKTDRATFSLRKGFMTWERPDLVEKEVPEEVGEDDLTSLQKLVINAVRHLAPGVLCSCPSDVFQLLKTFGFNRPYKTIYEAMQSANFRKEGFMYYLCCGEKPR